MGGRREPGSGSGGWAMAGRDMGDSGDRDSVSSLDWGVGGPVCHIMTISWQLHRCHAGRPPTKLAGTMSLATTPDPASPYVDRKRHAWVLSLAVPALVGLGPVLYAAWPHTLML